MKTLVLLVLSTIAANTAPLATLDGELRKSWPDNRTINIVFHGHSVPSGNFTNATPQP